MADSIISTGLDIMNRYQQATTGTKDGEFDPTINRTEAQKAYDKMYKDKTTLDFTDMLSLMIAQFQNQTPDNTADTSDMMNQLVQMSSMQAMTEMTSQIKELTTANVLMYSSSLVGQYVTVGEYDEKGKLHEIYGQVEAAGTYDGQQVIFIEGKSYYLSSIMAIGKLPEKTENTDENGETQQPWVDPDGTDSTDTSDKVDQSSGTDETGNGETEENEENSGQTSEVG